MSGQPRVWFRIIVGFNAFESMEAYLAICDNYIHVTVSAVAEIIFPSIQKHFFLNQMTSTDLHRTK